MHIIKITSDLLLFEVIIRVVHIKEVSASIYCI